MPPTRENCTPPSARAPQRFRLTGPSARLDPRTHAARRDIADVALADRLFAPHYARPHATRCLPPYAILRDAPEAGGRAVSQLLLGEAFAVVDVSGDWAWGYSAHDHYVGYVPMAALGEPEPASHRISAPLALLFAEPDIKAAVLAEWPMGARFAGSAQGDFLAVAGAGYVHQRHARPLDAPETDPVAVAERLIGAPYRWGGRGGAGVDCSGLIQLALGQCGIPAPRDSDQQRALGAEIPADAPLRRGDMLFFPGHVGLMADGERLLHANAHAMAVTVEPLADVVARLAPAHAEPIIARRRIQI